MTAPVARTDGEQRRLAAALTLADRVGLVLGGLDETICEVESGAVTQDEYLLRLQEVRAGLEAALRPKMPS